MHTVIIIGVAGMYADLVVDTVGFKKMNVLAHKERGKLWYELTFINTITLHKGGDLYVTFPDSI